MALSGWQRVTLSWTVSLACIGLLLYWVPVKEAWQSLLGADLALLLLAAAMTILNILLRGIRLNAILGRAHGRPGNTLILTYLCAIALGFNAVLPAKFGELARIGLAHRHLQLTIARTTQAAFVEKLCDTIALLAITALALQWIDLNGEIEYVLKAFHYLSITAGLLILLLLWLSFPRLNRALRKTINMAMRPLRARRLHRTLLRFLGEFGDNLRAITLTEAAVVVTLTPLIWLVLGIGGYFVALAMPGLTLSFPAALAFVSVTVLVTALPSAPGGWGVFEAAGLAMVLILAEPIAIGPAASFVLSAHLVQYVPVVLSAAVAYLLLENSKRH